MKNLPKKLNYHEGIKMNAELTACKTKVVELKSFIEYSGSSVVNTLVDKKAGIKL